MPEVRPGEFGGLIRGLGILVIVLAVASHDESLPAAWNHLGLPVLVALGVALALRNWLVACVGAGLLALARTHPGGDWITASAYPWLGSACLLLGGCACGQRFYRRMLATREARWRHRGSAIERPPAHSAADGSHSAGPASRPLP